MLLTPNIFRCSLLCTGTRRTPRCTSRRCKKTHEHRHTRTRTHTHTHTHTPRTNAHTHTHTHTLMHMHARAHTLRNVSRQAGHTRTQHRTHARPDVPDQTCHVSRSCTHPACCARRSSVPLLACRYDFTEERRNAEHQTALENWQGFTTVRARVIHRSLGIYKS